MGHALSQSLTEIATWLARGPVLWLAIAMVTIGAALLVNSARPRTDLQQRRED